LDGKTAVFSIKVPFVIAKNSIITPRGLKSEGIALKRAIYEGIRAYLTYLLDIRLKTCLKE